jgi:hypothetical protein
LSSTHFQYARAFFGSSVFSFTVGVTRIHPIGMSHGDHTG